MMDTTAGPIPGSTRRSWKPRPRSRHPRQDALKELLDIATDPLDNPAYQRLLVERPGYQEFADRKWSDLLGRDVGSNGARDGVSVGRPGCAAAALRGPSSSLSESSIRRC
jgi:hypothetical protein